MFEEVENIGLRNVFLLEFFTLDVDDSIESLAIDALEGFLELEASEVGQELVFILFLGNLLEFAL